LNSTCPKNRSERVAEFRVAIVKHEANVAHRSGDYINGVSGHLGHPVFGWMSGYAGQGYPASLQMNEEQHIICCQPSPSQHFYREEVYSGQDRHMGSNEIGPCCILTALRSGRNPKPPKDVADGLIGYVVIKISHRARNTVVTHSEFSLAIRTLSSATSRLTEGTAGIFPKLRAVELAGDQLTIPGQDRIGLGHAGDFLERFAPDSFTDLGQRRALIIRQLDPRWQMRSQDAIFCEQVLILK